MDEAEIRSAAELAVLRECGERGYREMELTAVLARSGLSRARFDRLYGSLERCYASAYSARTEALAARLEATGRRAGWRQGLRAVLRSLADFVEADPALAAGIVLEVGVASGEALASRDRLIARGVAALQAVDSDLEAREAPTRAAAELLVYTVEGAAKAALGAGQPDQFRAVLPDLAYLIVATCFDETTAQREARLVDAD